MYGFNTFRYESSCMVFILPDMKFVSWGDLVKLVKKRKTEDELIWCALTICTVSLKNLTFHLIMLVETNGTEQEVLSMPLICINRCVRNVSREDEVKHRKCVVVRPILIQEARLTWLICKVCQTGIIVLQ
jgi:hypothetical protein